MTLIWRSSEEASLVDAELQNYSELTGDGWYPDTCTPIPTPFPKCFLKLNGKKEPTDFFFAGPISVVSHALRDVLLRFNTKAEFLPLTVSVESGSTLQGYDLMNILDSAECLDREKSKFKMTEHGAKGIEYLEIDRNATVGHCLFLIGQIPTRVPNSHAVRDIVWCASEELATAVIKSGLTGVTFVKPEHHRAYPPSEVQWSPSES